MIVFFIGRSFKVHDISVYEIEFLRSATEVLILDIGLLLDKKSYRSAHGGIEHSSITVASSLIDLLKNLKHIYMVSRRSKVLFVNLLSGHGFYQSIVYVFFRITKSKVLRYKYVTVPVLSVPYLSKIKSYGVSYFINMLLKLATNRLFSWLEREPDYVLGIGEERKQKGKHTFFFNGNSHDYNLFLQKNSPLVGESEAHIVYIDSPSPMFSGDLEATRAKQTLSVKRWFESLADFFNKIEFVYGKKVVIAGHPKTKHDMNPSYFGGRRVVYNKTPELIRDSLFVVTRHSTAISFAVMFKKPLVFIYSDELICNDDQMKNLEHISNILSSYMVNINHNVYFCKHIGPMNAKKLNSEVILDIYRC